MTPDFFTQCRSRGILLAALICNCALSLATSVLAAPGDVDAAFNPNVSGANAYVFATAAQPDGILPRIKFCENGWQYINRQMRMDSI